MDRWADRCAGGPFSDIVCTNAVGAGTTHALVQTRKTAVMSFRAEREISGTIERFLVAALLEMTEIDLLRDHHHCHAGTQNLPCPFWPANLFGALLEQAASPSPPLAPAVSLPSIWCRRSCRRRRPGRGGYSRPGSGTRRWRPHRCRLRDDGPQAAEYLRVPPPEKYR